MYRYRLMLRQNHWWLSGSVLAASIALAAYGLYLNFAPVPVANFEECIKAGYKLIDGEPQTCTDGKRTFAAEAQASPAAAPQEEAPAEVVTMASMQTLVDGDSKGQYPARRQVIRDAASWQAFWAQVHAGLSPLPQLLPVDFARSDVVAITAGPSLKAGRHVSVTGVEVGKAGSIVYLREMVPAANCPAGKTVSNPYFLLSTDNLPEPVKYDVTSRERPCTPQPSAPAPTP